MMPAVYEDMEPLLRPFGKVVMAGGAVRDHLMGRTPKDFDIFVLGASWDDKLVEKVRDLLAPFEKVSELEFHLSEPYLVQSVRHTNGHVMQIMLNPAPTVSALVDTFDWNTCLFAYDGTVHAREDIANIAVGKELKLQTCRFPMSTLRRGFRFSERFGMELPKATIVSLCEKVVVKKAMPQGPEGNMPDMPSLAANVLVEERP